MQGGPQPCWVAGGGDSRQPGQAPLPTPAGWPCARACVLPAPGPAACLPGGVRALCPSGSDTKCLPAVWLTTQNHSTLVTERSAVPFLPVNPEYSATRNQVRPALGHTTPLCTRTPAHPLFPPPAPRAGRSWPGSTPGSSPPCSSTSLGKPSAGSKGRVCSAPQVRHRGQRGGAEHSPLPCAQHPPALPQTPSTTRCGARVTWTTSTTTTALPLTRTRIRSCCATPPVTTAPG